MAMLGDLLASARQESGNFHAWLRSADPELGDRVAVAAAEQSLTPTGYVRLAMADFARLASEEDWATLISTVKQAEDPGMACLGAMLDWRLTARACQKHSPPGSH